jgi:hypothetical protein
MPPPKTSESDQFKFVATNLSYLHAVCMKCDTDAHIKTAERDGSVEQVEVTCPQCKNTRRFKLFN